MSCRCLTNIFATSLQFNDGISIQFHLFHMNPGKYWLIFGKNYKYFRPYYNCNIKNLRKKIFNSIFKCLFNSVQVTELPPVWERVANSAYRL